MATDSKMIEQKQPMQPEHVAHIVTCMGTLVSALTQYFGSPLSRNSLINGLPLHNGIVQEAQIAALASKANLSIASYEGPLKNLNYLNLPAVLIMNNEQACVLLEVKKDDKLVLLTPVGGKLTIDIATIEANYTGRAYTIQPSVDSEIKKRTGKILGHWLWSLAWKQRKTYFEAASGSLIVNVLGLALPLFIMAVYDRIIPNNALESLSVLLSGMILVAFTDFFLRYLRAYALDHAGRYIDTCMGNHVFQHLLYVRLDNHRSAGSTANTIREMDVLREFLNSSMLSLISDVPFLFLFVFMVYLIGGPLAWVPIIIMPLVLIFFLSTQFPLHRLMKKTYMNASNRNAVLFEILNGIESVKALGAESWVADRWERAHAAGVKTAFASRFYNLINANVLVFAQTASMVSIITMGVFLIRDGELSFGALFACVILNGRAMAPVSQISQVIGRLHAVYVAYVEINKIMSLPLERDIEDLSTEISTPVTGDLVFDDVSFSYKIMGTLTESKITVFKDITCKINAGERIAIVGSIGAGKSTVLKLILNLISPEGGTLRIDGIDSRKFDTSELRSQISYMPQNLHFFMGTIRSNLTIHYPHATESQILRAVRASGIGEWLATCPLGLAQPVGERGEFLSGGQRQSLALARCLINDTKLILMDEPTSLLDSQSEIRFVQRIKQLLDDQTFIVATHRPAMLEVVDRIIVFDKGKIALDGPKQAILNKLAGEK